MGSQEIGSGSDRPAPRKRTKTGCITCRIRRVKCDETRPSCNRCTQSKRVCDGYLPNTEQDDPRGESSGNGRRTTTVKPVSRRALAIAIRQVNVVGPAVRVLAPSPYLEDDVACFDFFRLRLTAVSSDPKDSAQSVSGFWNCTLLQAAHLEPAVWQAVAALGALYRRWEVVSGGGGGGGGGGGSGGRHRLSRHAKKQKKEGKNLLWLEASSSSSSSSSDDTGSHVSTPSSSSSDEKNEDNDDNDDEDHDDHGHGSGVADQWNEQSVRLADQAGTCYSSAMRLASSIRDPSTMLVLSLALAAAANLSGRWVDSSVHFRAGQRIMTQLRSEAQGRPIRDVEMHAAESLARLGVQWLSFGDQRAPWPRDSEEAFFMLPSSSEAGQYGVLWSLHRAHIALIGILGRVLAGAGGEDIEREQQMNVPAADTNNTTNTTDRSHSTATSTTVPSPTEAEAAVVRDLEAWEQNLTDLLESNSVSSSANPHHHHTNPLDLLALKLLHAATRLLLAANIMRPDYSELGWDGCLGYFERILALVALVLRAEAHKNPLLQSVMSLDEPAINVVLWLTAYRCRHPILRRRALALLQRARRLEGVWMSTSTAAAARKVIEVEETGGLSRNSSSGPSATLEQQQQQQQQQQREEEDNNSGFSFSSSSSLPSYNVGGWSAVEAALNREIEAEDPRSWLGPHCARRWASESKMGWGVLPGDFVVPLRRRVTHLGVLAEYDPRVGRSRADLVLHFADWGVDGQLRREMLSVYF
ncbi:hypothetical protein M406DRAFT_334507 [Cryphonectria parasitica EP155]|uniref:Zn(2)-C6 fungal-type domain-containing protein n=1 Tax=Cryphonectria parasitica (strain ATCC 38755 / EP155) TaxID=660469 RepID=A0A9P4XT94_CRYP1|nr:uncharacterized protein M406DRAFT_334507 [Cryphonectria parasitica EP155]KAF3760884.1 hypothetical protein M406DRAFT_334507 [Cryphonectria parasitica EP155]